MTTRIRASKLKTALLLCLVGASLTGCGSDDPAAPTPTPTPTAKVTWEANTLIAYHDCDVSGGPGDFYISLSLSDMTSGEEVVLAEKRGVLVQVNSGASASASQIGLALSSDVPLRDGTRLLLNMSFYENDPGGPQVSIGNGWYYTYSETAGRWESEDGQRSVEAGFAAYETLRLQDFYGDICDVLLRGKFSMDAAAR